MQRYFFSLFVSLVLGLRIVAQPYCSVKTFNLRDGLASNVITGLVQTPDQLMWFSTWNGLTCYDGYHFTNYRTQGQHRTLTTNRLLNIQASQTGNVWCITYDQKPFLFDRRQSTFVDIGSYISQQYGDNFHTSRAIPMKNGHTWLLNIENGGAVYRVADDAYWQQGAIEQYPSASWIVEDADGDEWILYDDHVSLLGSPFDSDLPFVFIQQVGRQVFLATADGHLSYYDKEQGRLHPFEPEHQPGQVLSLVQAGERWLVVASPEGLLLYDAAQHQQRFIPLGRVEDRSLTADSQGRLWAVMADHRTVSCIQLATGDVRRYDTTASLSPISQSSNDFFHEDRNHTIWMGTSQGFFGYYDEPHDCLCPSTLRTSASQPSIDRFMADAQGNLWFSGEHNLAVGSPRYRHINHVFTWQEMRSVMYDHEGRIWTGSLGGDIFVYTPDGQLQGYLWPDGRIRQQHQAFSTHIYCLFEDQQHRIWIGTKGDGLFCLDTDGQLSHFKSEDSTPGTLPSNQIYAVHQDHQGRIWVGTFEQGICLIDSADSGIRFLSAPADLRHYPIDNFHKVRRITETRDGIIIVSCSNGLVTFSEQFTSPADLRFYAHKHVQGDSTSLLTSDVMQALVTSHDTVLVATVGGGMQLAPVSSLLHDSVHFSTVSRLLSDYGTVLTLTPDREDNLWIGRENSLNMLEKRNGQLWDFGPGHIGENTEMTEAQPAFNPQTGQIALATTDGFICFQPERLQDDNYAPPLVFTGIQLHGVQEEEQRMLMGDTLELEASQRHLTIHFAALDYQDNYMIRYAYQLEGIDNEWNYLGTEHSISFSSLPHGHHRLLVRSTNSYGSWADNVMALNLYVHPTFWETGWAKLLYALLGLLVLGVAIWIYRLYVRNSMERKLNDMKTQFFTDVSHKLRTPLTLIGAPVTQVLQAGGLSDMARQHLEMVERNARRMLGLVNKMLIYSKEHHTYISDENLSGEQLAMTDERLLEAPNHPLAGHQPSPLPSASSVRLLIVEDNDDLRQFLVSILQSDYEVLQADNGREGLEKAQAEQPDFILTDVMMPEMDGLTMVHRIKADPDISHIPIVILSAKASMDDRLEGLKAGVNDYITKPFSATYLKQRMQNIIQNQRLLQQTILASIKPNERTVWEEEPAEAADTTSTTDEPAPEEGQTLRLKATTIVDTDKQMMEQLLEYIEANLSNADLRIEDLASALCLGRTVFYNKVKTLVGMSPVELLRHIRIQHAEDMVAKSTMPFSQIAYAVGFSDPRYFGKCFKKQTGLTPSEYREQHVS